MSTAASIIQAAANAAEVVYYFGRDSYGFFQSKHTSSENLQENYEMLIREVQTLQALTKDYDAEVEGNKMKIPTSTYRLWKDRVLEISLEVEKLRSLYERKRLPRWYILQRSQLSNKMAKKLKEAGKLVEEGKFLGGFLVDKPEEPVKGDVSTE